MTTRSGDPIPCQCPLNCGCGSTSDLVHAGAAICGCCFADCPDVHGTENGTENSGYTVRLVPWNRGYELHVDGVGVTQCTDPADAEPMVRDFLEALDVPDALTAKISLVHPRG